MTLLEPIMHYLTTCDCAIVTLKMVINGAQRDRKQVLRVLDKLTREGYLHEITDNLVPPAYGEVGPPRRNPTWRIVRDLGERPQPNPPRKLSLRSRVWKTIRAKRRFTKADLVITSGASPATVDEYVRQLERAGYLRRTGRDGLRITYLLTKNNQVEPPSGLWGAL